MVQVTSQGRIQPWVLFPQYLLSHDLSSNLSAVELAIPFSKFLFSAIWSVMALPMYLDKGTVVSCSPGMSVSRFWLALSRVSAVEHCLCATY